MGCREKYTSFGVVDEEHRSAAFDLRQLRALPTAHLCGVLSQDAPSATQAGQGVLNTTSTQ